MPLPLSIIVPVAIAGLFWLGLYARATGIIGVCLATIVAGSVFGYEFVHVGPVTSDRLPLALVCLMYFMQRSVFGSYVVYSELSRTYSCVRSLVQKRAD